MKILSIGSDRKLFEDEEAVVKRIKGYGTLVNEIHIIVFTLKSLGLKEKQIAPNVWVYPTNSRSRWLYIRDAEKIGKRLVEDKKFVRGLSVITTQDPFESGLVGLRVKRYWRLPLEVQLHTDLSSPYFRGALNWLRKRIAKKVLRQADSVRVVGAELKASIAHLTKAKINVLPIYVDQQRIAEGRITFDLHARYGWRFILLAVSRLTAEKNLFTALKALALVRERFPDTGLVIVGSGPDKRYLMSLVKKLNLSDAVAFVGWQKDLTSFYKTANAFIQTSLFEGYGLSLIEAGLSGLPVVTTPVGMAAELRSGQDAYICLADSPMSFARGIIDLIENNHKREHIRINLKHILKTKLVSKEEYLKVLKANWEETALMIK